MREELGVIRGIFVVAAVIAALLLAAGCGGESSDATGATGATVGEITVQGGSLSKDEFIEKADEICRETRKEFNAEYEKFLTENTKQPQAVLAKELVETIVVPHFEEEIREISELGAPENYAGEVAAFLSALKQRLNQGERNPLGLIAANVFKKATVTARKAGLNGCAQSLN